MFALVPAKVILLGQELFLYRKLVSASQRAQKPTYIERRKYYEKE